MEKNIGIKKNTFFGAVNSLRTAATGVTVGSYKAETSGSSEVVKEYTSCMQEIQALISSYKVFISEDIERINGAGKAMVTAEKSLVGQK